MRHVTPLTEEQLKCLEEKRFFILKRETSEKIMEVFTDLNNSITDVLRSQLHLPDEIQNSNGKISRGENYKGFPWMVLDQPRVFTRSDVFAFRSLCYWGHDFSFTLHLSGIYLPNPQVQQQLMNELLGSESYYCINDTPWEYHFQSDNYIPLKDAINQNSIRNDFIKISCRLPLHEMQQVPDKGLNIYKRLTGIL